MAGSGDPVGSGLVTSLARPGGNVTGTSLIAPELYTKRLDLLKAAFPRIVRVVILWNPANPAEKPWLEEVIRVAPKLGVQPQPLKVASPTDLEQAFSAMATLRPDALLVFADPVVGEYRTRIIEFAASQRLPAMYPFRDWVYGGGIMSYGWNLVDVSRHVATYVDKVLKGAKPGDLPVEQPTRFELVVNLKAAKAQGLTISESVLTRADEVIR